MGTSSCLTHPFPHMPAGTAATCPHRTGCVTFRSVCDTSDMCRCQFASDRSRRQVPRRIRRYAGRWTSADHCTQARTRTTVMRSPVGSVMAFVYRLIGITVPSSRSKCRASRSVANRFACSGWSLRIAFHISCTLIPSHQNRPPRVDSSPPPGSPAEDVIYLTRMYVSLGTDLSLVKHWANIRSRQSPDARTEVAESQVREGSSASTVRPENQRAPRPRCREAPPPRRSEAPKRRPTSRTLAAWTPQGRCRGHRFRTLTT